MSKSLIGREIYFKMSKVNVIKSGTANLTPNKLYTVIKELHDMVIIENDKGTEILTGITTTSAHLGEIAKFILKREVKSNG
jgi:hypothetical protein